MAKKDSGIWGCIKKSMASRLGGDPPPLLCPVEATFRLLGSVLGAPVQKRQEYPRSPAEGYRDDEGPGALPI